MQLSDNKEKVDIVCVISMLSKMIEYEPKSDMNINGMIDPVTFSEMVS